MIKITHGLKDMIIRSLRYSLGRTTYATGQTADFIMDNPKLIDERVCIVMLRDLKYYFEDRKKGLKSDDKCDYDSWVKLENWLFNLAKEKGLNVINYEKR